ncbi:MAG: outer membrane protein assembly factor BamA [Bdellovibrionaceae bacterium]|nr:outer membrane protein assembly factor BamA [Pseudobdellovibrionaceae bacterium]
MKIFSGLILPLFVMASVSQAQVVKSIGVDGNQRIEDQAILTKIKSKAGQTLDRKQVAEDIRTLFETQFFNHIKVDFNDGYLTYIVDERAVISELVFLGNKSLDNDELSEVINVKTFQLLDKNLLDEAVSKIQKAYEEKGYYLTRATYEVEELKEPPGSVKLKIKIDERSKIKIKKVRFIGNENLSDSFLSARMLTKPTGWFGMGGAFKEEALERDAELVRFLYLNEGYAQVKIDPPRVNITPDKKGIEIVFRLEEGPKFKIGRIEFSGDLLKTRDEFLELIKVHKEEYFSQQVIMQDMAAIQAVYGDEGYAYANIIPRPIMNDKDAIMDIVFDIHKGEKVKIGEIKITGNTKTRDKVIRRQVRLIEGELYNETKKRESVANINRLSYFKNVDMQPTTAGGGASDVMDLNIQVEETSTGTLNFGVGFGGWQGFSVQGSMNQINLFGRGESLGVSINWTENIDRLFNLNYTDPFFLDTDWSFGFDVYQNIRLLPDFRERRAGAAVRLGRRYGDFWRTSMRYKFDKTFLEFGDNALRDIYPIPAEKASEGFTSSLTATLEYDRRNNRMFPTDGFYSSASFEYAGIGGDLNYSELLLNARFYRPIYGSLIFRNNMVYGLLFANGSDNIVPINQLYRIGGPNSVRGYNFFTVAKRKYSPQAYVQLTGTPNAWYLAHRPYGGTQQFYYNAEFEWGLVKEAGIKGVVFFDVGHADDSLNVSRLKSSYGAGIRWISPMGPLRFEWGFPVDPDERYGEKKMNFDFSIHSTF